MCCDRSSIKTMARNKKAVFPKKKNSSGWTYLSPRNWGLRHIFGEIIFQCFIVWKINHLKLGFITYMYIYYLDIWKTWKDLIIFIWQLWVFINIYIYDYKYIILYVYMRVIVSMFHILEPPSLPLEFFIHGILGCFCSWLHRCMKKPWNQVMTSLESSL